MRLQKSVSKNSCVYYVAKSFRTLEGRYSSKIVERLGSPEDLVRRFGPDDPEGRAKEYAMELGREERAAREKIKFELSPGKLIDGNARRSYNVGYLFLQKAYHQFGIDRICRKIADARKAEFDLNGILKMLLYSRVLYPGSKRSSLEDASAFIEKPSSGLHQVYRALSLMADEIDTFQSELYKNSLGVMERRTGVIYYDCTNYFFESEQEGGLRQYGKSKENRPNPIVQLGMFMDMDGFPLAFCINPGNTNEQVTLKPLEEKLEEKFGISKMVVCTDAGLSSYGNRLHNSVSNRSYITVQSLKTLKAAYQEWALDPKGWKLYGRDRDGKWLESDTEYDIDKLDGTEHRDCTFYKERWIVDEVKAGGGKQTLSQRIIVTYSVKYRDYLRTIRNLQIARAESQLGKGVKAVERVHPNSPRRFYKRTSFTDDGEVADNVAYEIDREAVEQEEKFDGFYAVCTDLEDAAQDILLHNSYRWQIEDCFRITKTDLKSRPVYLRRDERIRAHFLTCFLALFLVKYLLKRVNLGKKYGDRISVHQMIDTMRKMNMLFIGGEGYIPEYQRTEISNRLHGACGFRTDCQIVTKRAMNMIIAGTKRKDKQGTTRAERKR